MIERLNVQSTSLEFKKLIVDVDTVYKNYNESKLLDEETTEHIGWIYDQIQYDKNEYIELISEENEMLSEALIEMALNTDKENKANEQAIIEIANLIGGMM